MIGGTIPLNSLATAPSFHALFVVAILAETARFSPPVDTREYPLVGGQKSGGAKLAERRQED
jgi:hypothetical protein